MSGLNFRALEPADAPRYISCFSKCAVKMSYYSFGNALAYVGEYALNAYYDEALDMYFTRGEKCDAAPVGSWENRDWRSIIKNHYGQSASFEAVPKALCAIWQNDLADAAEIEIADRRDMWEYIYTISSLATLSGRKLTKKRNHCNHFRRDYAYDFVPFSADLKPLIERFQAEWYGTHKAYDIEGLSCENEAVEKILANCDQMPYICGGAIIINGAVEAYTIGEIQGDTLYTHFEKASVDYDGAYQVINREFAQYIAANYKDVLYVNREEDLGDEGLREAKMSYMPLAFAEACSVKITFRE